MCTDSTSIDIIISHGVFYVNMFFCFFYYILLLFIEHLFDIVLLSSLIYLKSDWKRFCKGGVATCLALAESRLIWYSHQRGRNASGGQRLGKERRRLVRLRVTAPPRQKLPRGEARQPHKRIEDATTLAGRQGGRKRVAKPQKQKKSKGGFATCEALGFFSVFVVDFFFGGLSPSGKFRRAF